MENENTSAIFAEKFWQLWQALTMAGLFIKIEHNKNALWEGSIYVEISDDNGVCGTARGWNVCGVLENARDNYQTTREIWNHRKVDLNV